MKTSRSLLVLSTVILIAEPALSRLPLDSDLPSVVELESLDYFVRKNGTYDFDTNLKIAILTEAGRTNEAVQKVSFNSRASSFELISAETINDGKPIKVPSSNVEIKEVGDSKTFDATKEAIISFPMVRVGSKINLRYRLRVKEVPIEGFFSTGVNVTLGNSDRIERKIKSELPLHISIHDPMSLLEVKNRTEGRYSIVEISNKEKIRLGVVQEDAPFVDNGRLPSVMVSSRSSWTGFADKIIAEQERLLRAPLPPVFLEIRNQAEKKPVASRMAFVAGEVAKELRYFGDWRRRNGGHMPRTLDEIAATGYGDCKDMSLVLVAIARSMGLKADLAWIWRSDVYLDESYYRLPNDYGFNHAVARVVDGTVQWLDATNPVSLVGLVFADIAQRPTLVLNSTGAVLERTPDLASKENLTRVDLEMRMRKDGVFNLEGSMSQTGRAAARVEWARLYSPEDQFKYDTARWLARNERLDSYSIEFAEGPNRVVRDFVGDLKVRAKFSVPDLGLRTTAGVGFPLLRSETVDLMLIDPRERFSDLWLGWPSIYEERYKIPSAQTVGRDSVDCRIESEWARLSRKVRAVAGEKNKAVEIINRIEVLKSIVPNQALTKKSFVDFQSAVRRCFNRSAVILTLTSSESSKVTRSN